QKELEPRRQELDDPQDARAAALDRQLGDLDHLREYAMPLIDRLEAMPVSATWGEWLTELRDLTNAAIRDNERILETLAELEPMSPIGPVDIDELLLVLTSRLGELSIPPQKRRYGKVFVGPAEAARGMAFDVVFIPGLAEKLFPRKIAEDPILLDDARKKLNVEGLPQQNDRLEAERLLLRLSAGVARDRVYLSYPRIDIEQSRARVPSLYLLEAFRAAEGTLPDLDRLERLARTGPKIRLGWPAPEDPSVAIDEAEYDLALLSPMIGAGATSKSKGTETAAAIVDSAGAAHYLLTANPHLARSLRRRARRWLRRWTVEDGLVDPDDLARGALAAHQLAARSYSPTGLQNYASCPYKFFLQAVLRLQPLDEKAALETIDPLTRGALFHDCQFEILTELRRRALLPLSPDKIGQAMEIADRLAKEVADGYRDNLFPAIPRVWEDGMNAILADLREWLRRSAYLTDGWIPHMFELSFGLADRDRPHQDPASIDSAVEIIGGLKVRGSIDLVERRRDGVLRVTDHKTGKIYAKADVVVGGGRVLQPVVYALVCEKMLGQKIDSGRLYYCTSDGGFSERVVPFDEDARNAAASVVETIGRALEEGFLPAAPEKGSCSRCDYRLACGPGEETRTRIQKGKGGIKPADRVKSLLELREMP
ncbi:MAG: PD-(D/E)XK nuclease family protein, partial [Blastocatellia bacterium]